MAYGKFLVPLRVELQEGRKNWKLIDDFMFVTYKGDPILVPKGFITNFASIPRIPIIFDLVGNYGHAAATLHDYLYRRTTISREECDNIFYQALRTTGIASWRARLMWLGVRAFGWKFRK